MAMHYSTRTHSLWVIKFKILVEASNTYYISPLSALLSTVQRVLSLMISQGGGWGRGGGGCCCQAVYPVSNLLPHIGGRCISHLVNIGPLF